MCRAQTAALSTAARSVSLLLVLRLLPLLKWMADVEAFALGKALEARGSYAREVMSPCPRSADEQPHESFPKVSHLRQSANPAQPLPEQEPSKLLWTTRASAEENGTPTVPRVVPRRKSSLAVELLGRP